PREAARDLGLADAGRADHQDVLRHHLLAQLLVELQAAPAVAQRDRDCALGVALADDEAVELGNDFAGREVGHAAGTTGGGRRAIDAGVGITRTRRNGCQPTPRVSTMTPSTSSVAKKILVWSTAADRSAYAMTMPR